MKIKLLLALSTGLNVFLLGVAGSFLLGKSDTNQSPPPHSAMTAGGAAEISKEGSPQSAASLGRSQPPVDDYATHRQPEAQTFPTEIRNPSVVETGLTASVSEPEPAWAQSVPTLENPRPPVEFRTAGEPVWPLAFQVPLPAQLNFAPNAVFGTSDPRAVEINEAQKAVIGQLQEKFLSDVGGENQNPNDPEYRKRWMKAQPLLDEQMMTTLGTERFNLLQIQAAQKEYLSGQR